MIENKQILTGIGVVLSDLQDLLKEYCCGNEITKRITDNITRLQTIIDEHDVSESHENFLTDLNKITESVQKGNIDTSLKLSPYEELVRSVELLKRDMMNLMTFTKCPFDPRKNPCDPRFDKRSTLSIFGMPRLEYELYHPDVSAQVTYIKDYLKTMYSGMEILAPGKYTVKLTPYIEGIELITDNGNSYYIPRVKDIDINKLLLMVEQLFEVAHIQIMPEEFRVDLRKHVKL